HLDHTEAGRQVEPEDFGGEREDGQDIAGQKEEEDNDIRQHVQAPVHGLSSRQDAKRRDMSAAFASCIDRSVRAAGFEPTTSSTPLKRATKLRHAPNKADSSKGRRPAQPLSRGAKQTGAGADGRRTLTTTAARRPLPPA